MPSADAIRPFKVDITSEELDRLRQRIRDTRYPTEDIVQDASEDYGIPTSWAIKLLNRWQTSYSWLSVQAHLNSLSHCKTHIESIDLHFIHERSDNAEAIPILLIHGWPGSFHEFSEVIEPLCKGSGSQAFHCIIPSLPGFTFSSSPPTRSWTVKDTARIFHTLMLRLGYTRYVVQAGDWGQFVARELGANPAYSGACQAIHLNYCPGALPPNIQENDLTTREKQARDRGINWRTDHVGYAVLMRTRPQTLGFMLEDNPIGLMAFVGEKYHEASSPSVHNDPKWLDHVLTTVCLYYFTNCITSSAMIYYNNTPHHEFASYAEKEENQIKCLFAYTSYAYDTAPNSKRAVERTGNLVLYRERDHAGHFAALEDPDGVVEDVRELVGKVWKG